MSEPGLVYAAVFDGSGGARQLDWSGVSAWQAAQGILWIHLNRESVAAERWISDDSHLDPLVCEALMAESTRPRCVQMGEGVMLFLRGVNLNPGADPEDMVSIRLWVEPGRIVSVRQRRLMSVDDLRASLAQGSGAVDEGDFTVQLAERLVARMVDVINDVDDAVDAVQAEVLESGSIRLRSELTRLRHEIIALRRYLAPQRDALLRLGQIKPAWLHEEHQLQLREQADRVTRFVEDLDAARERAAVTQEELGNRLSEQMNTRMYVLSLVAAVFLPLGFLTGLFGINVGGMPLAEDPWGFWEVSGLLAAITAIQVLLFRWRGWF